MTTINHVSSKNLYTRVLRDGEFALVTTNQNGIIHKHELGAQQYKVIFENGSFAGFYDPYTHTLYTSPSALCKSALKRNGETNEWNGPKHVQLYRDGQWVSLRSLL